MAKWHTRRVETPVRLQTRLLSLSLGFLRFSLNRRSFLLCLKEIGFSLSVGVRKGGSIRYAVTSVVPNGLRGNLSVTSCSCVTDRESCKSLFLLGCNGVTARIPP